MTSAKQVYLGVRRGAPTPPLPYDAEVEYLESTGTQWINTGYETKGVGITIDVVASKTTSATNEMAIAGRAASSGFELYFANGLARIWTVSFDIPSAAGISANNAYHIVAETASNSQSITVDGVVDSRTGSVAGAAGLSPIALFAHRQTYNLVGRIYSCKIYDGATLVRDFTPVRFTNEQNQSDGAMYDRVSGALFRNAGTGEFRFGTDIAWGGCKWLGYSPLRFSRSTRLWKEAA